MSKKKAFIKIAILSLLLVVVIIFTKLNVSNKLTLNTLAIMIGLVLVGILFNIAYLIDGLISGNNQAKTSKALTDWVGFFSISILSILMVLTFFISTSKVEGASMKPTLNDKDILFVYYFNYEPKHNDIVIIKNNDVFLVKRLIGLPGDYIELRHYNTTSYSMHLNGSEEFIKDGYGNIYLTNKSNTALKEGVNNIKQGQMFILGDNGITNDNSSDSKQHGFYNIENIVGKVIRK